MAVKSEAAQNFVPIKEVRDGIVLLKDGGLRAVLITSSINISLKSADEQQAIMMQFQGFLNTLDFSTQIVIQSRRLNIKPYLALLATREEDVVEPLIKIQIREYINFIKRFTDEVAIMKKSFFVVVPYSPPAIAKASDFQKLIPSFMNTKTSTEQQQDSATLFEEQRSQLEQRVNIIQSGLSAIGVRSKQLKTEELIELFYKIFNPGETESPAGMVQK